MELIDIIPEFNLYEEFWKIYTKSDVIPPQYIADSTKVEGSIIGEGSEIYGSVYNSVIGAGVTIEEGAIVRDSIIMNGTVIGKNTEVNKSIISEYVKVGDNVVLGAFDEVENKVAPSIYAGGLTTIGEYSIIPDGVKIGKNTAVFGETKESDYQNRILASGETLIKVGELS